MRLFIAEKPSVARCLIDALGLRKKENGYYIAISGDIVTWCFGHLLEPAPPDDYLSKDVPLNSAGKAKWRFDDLPIMPDTWINKPKKDAQKQLKIIKGLLKQADTVVNCGDPDREGQLLVDEILEFYNCRKPVLRYICSAQDQASVKKALSNLQPNSNFAGMAAAAKARQRADWLIGMNLTRAYTLANHDGKLIAIGRVQTPTLNLVANRTLEIRSFKPKPYYTISAQFRFNKISFKADLVTKDIPTADQEGRFFKNADGYMVTLDIGQYNYDNFIVSSVTTEQKELNHPKSLSLADIQQYASAKYGLSAKETLDVCQSLYEVHKLTTYPRSDCSYLPEIQHKEASVILKSLAQVNPNLTDLILRANIDIKSNTWDDTKVTAHHGIIPTAQIADRSKLTSNEQKIYSYIVFRYLAQFFPKSVISYTTITISLDNSNYQFEAHGFNVVKEGFMQVTKDFASLGDNQELPACQKGDRIIFKELNYETHKTKAPSAFTEGSLIRAMENIAKFVDDPSYKKLLTEGDGIGTSATRAAIIEELKRKGYLKVDNKKLVATDLAFAFLGKVPDILKKPDLTAIYENKFKSIEQGSFTLSAFENSVVKPFVDKQVSYAKVTK